MNLFSQALLRRDLRDDVDSKPKKEKKDVLKPFEYYRPEALVERILQYINDRMRGELWDEWTNSLLINPPDVRRGGLQAGVSDDYLWCVGDRPSAPGTYRIAL